MLWYFEESCVETICSVMCITGFSHPLYSVYGILRPSGSNNNNYKSICLLYVLCMLTGKERNPCRESPCGNGGVCMADVRCVTDKKADVSDPKCHKCLCLDGYTGRACQTSEC